MTEVIGRHPRIGNRHRLTPYSIHMATCYMTLHTRQYVKAQYQYHSSNRNWYLQFKRIQWDFVYHNRIPFNGSLDFVRDYAGEQALERQNQSAFTEARDSEWQWHQLGHMQIYTSPRQITMPASHHSVFHRPDAIPAPNQHRQSTEGSVHSSSIKHKEIMGKQLNVKNAKETHLSISDSFTQQANCIAGHRCFLRCLQCISSTSVLSSVFIERESQKLTYSTY